MEEELTPEEKKALKELVTNLMAMGRVRRMFTTVLLWAAGIVSAALILQQAGAWFSWIWNGKT